VKRGTSRKVHTRGNVIRSLCCLPLDEFGEEPQADWPGTDDSSLGSNSGDSEHSILEVETPRSIGALTTTSELVVAERELLTTMRSSFSKFFVAKESVPLQTDAITEAFYNARYIKKVNQYEILEKATVMYGVKTSEYNAINSWIVSYLIGEDTISGSVQSSPKLLLGEKTGG
jgi:hypothetical protein